MNIVYLYTEVMPYLTVVLRQLAEYGNTINVFYLDKYRQTPFVPEKIECVDFHETSSLDKRELLSSVEQYNPDIIVVCGWSDSKYRYVARCFKRQKGIPVICPIDTQYLGRIKQIAGFLISGFFVKKMFTHIWVPGVRQYHFARLLGYKPNQILMYSLTGNTKLFSTANIEKKRILYPKSFLFVGRYNPVKGLDCFLEAWDLIQDKRGWTITTVGNGPLKDMLKNRNDINVLDFTDQANLTKLSENQGVFVLPSRYEPWALVLQEFAAAGLPIICSDACGASDHFVIDGYNGFLFETGSAYDLKCKLEYIMNMDTEELMRMAERSRTLSLYTSPEKSANALLSSVRYVKSQL